ncbi:MAG: hypothetical protein AMXMBFR13_42320 [Phycisphaerae bacterium]
MGPEALARVGAASLALGALKWSARFAARGGAVDTSPSGHENQIPKPITLHPVTMARPGRALPGWHGRLRGGDPPPESITY